MKIGCIVVLKGVNIAGSNANRIEVLLSCEVAMYS